MEDVVYIHGIEQVNIGTEEKPFYLPKLTEEQIKIYTNYFKSLNKK